VARVRPHPLAVTAPPGRSVSAGRVRYHRRVAGTNGPTGGPTGGPASRSAAAETSETAMTSITAPTREREETTDEVAEADVPWIVIVWNDPINLMSYVVFVLQKLFGYSKEKATKLMLDVHHKGRAVVSSGPREKAEFDVFRLHGHGLWATMQKDR
jgi:ATP-dependent Clp protease adaptor protein ClpS